LSHDLAVLFLRSPRRFCSSELLGQLRANFAHTPQSLSELGTAEDADAAQERYDRVLAANLAALAACCGEYWLAASPCTCSLFARQS